jgi:hypothetical protein
MGSSDSVRLLPSRLDNSSKSTGARSDADSSNLANPLAGVDEAATAAPLTLHSDFKHQLAQPKPPPESRAGIYRADLNAR